MQFINLPYTCTTIPIKSARVAFVKNQPSDFEQLIPGA